MPKPVSKFAAAACSAAFLLSASPALSSSSTGYLYTGEGIYSELDYLCDATDGQSLIAVVKYEKGHASHALTFDRMGFKNAQNHWVKLGAADAGAGQVRYPLIDHTDGKERGHVHTINPGMLGDPDAIAFPALSSVTLDGNRSECRFDKDAVFFGVSEDHSYMILRDGDGYKLNIWFVRDPQDAPEVPNFDRASVDGQGNRSYVFAIGHTTMTIKVPQKPDKGGAKIHYEHDSGETRENLLRAYVAMN